MCGGTADFHDAAIVDAGLSPRVRGNQCQYHDDARLCGSIPACAGEPRSRDRYSSPSPVYPRVCGGTAAAEIGYTSCGGLSPRVRGNPGGRGLGRRCRRSIPACAGEPEQDLKKSTIYGVYPRVCGGTGHSDTVAIDSEGLSPRVRGNLVSAVALATVQRSIPACAGEPIVAQPPCLVQKVYPRVCGGTLLSTKGMSPG